MIVGGPWAVINGENPRLWSILDFDMGEGPNAGASSTHMPVV